jgi:hypothetical protein
MIGPDIDPDHKVSWSHDLRRARIRAISGTALWGALTLPFFAALASGYPTVLLVIMFGGPALLLVLTRYHSLGRLPVVLVMPACVAGVLWEFQAALLFPWAGAVFGLYLLGFEKALSGLAKLHYLRSTAGLGHHDVELHEQDMNHLIAKRRIWGYLLVTASIAAVGGSPSADGYQEPLLLLLILTLLMRTHLFRWLLSLAWWGRPFAEILTHRRRFPNVVAALLNAAGYGVLMLVYVTAALRYPGAVDLEVLSDILATATACALWALAAFRLEWTV